MTNLRLLLPVLLFAACSTHSVIEQSKAYARLGDHMHAYEVLEVARAEQAANGGEVDAELAAAHASARKEFLRARARHRIFQEKEDGALADLVELEKLDPSYPGIDEMRNRALRKKAQRSVLKADEHLLRKEFKEALACYGAANAVLPDFAAAVDGIERVRQATASMTARAHDQFLEAVRKLPEFRYIEVQWHAGNVIHNDPTRTDAKEIQSKAQRENAQKAMARGKDCEKKEQFGAALLEYREAHRLDRELPEAQTAIVLMEQELQALSLVDKAQIEMRSGRFDVAREQLAKAFDLSTLARPQISELIVATKKREGETRYQVALDLEVLGKKAEALAGFEIIAADFPDGLKDEKAHIVGLKADLDGAAKEWAAAEAAEAAGDLPKALEHYKNSERFYSTWKDAKARIERLTEEIAKKPATPPAPAEGSTPPAGNGEAVVPPAPTETPVPAPATETPTQIPAPGTGGPGNGNG